MLRRWLTPNVLLAVVSVGLLAAGLVRFVEVSAPDRPTGTWRDLDDLKQRDDLNVVFVMIDTLRADRLSAYGYERKTSATFDALADSGILFENVLTQSSWTKAAMASQWTATYPSSNRITRYQHAIPRRATTAAELLAEEGFRTVGIYRNNWVAPNFGFAQGFDLYYMPEAGGGGKLQENPSAYELAGTDLDITRAAQEVVRGMGSQRFLLYVHYMDVHQYVYDDAVDFGSTYSDIYDQSVHWVDRNLGSLVATLQEEGLMKRTLLVVSSDHGEAFGEHGTEGHARNLYRETSDVPLLVTLPFRLEEGIRVETPVENVDMWPTVLDLMGLPPLPGAEGRSLVPVVRAAARGEPTNHAAPRFAHLDRHWGNPELDSRPLVSVSEGGYRLFQLAGDPDELELYDIEADPGEQHDIAADEPERVETLRERLREHTAREVPWGRPDEVHIDAMQLKQLQALGYAVGGEERGKELPDFDEEDADAPR